MGILGYVIMSALHAAAAMLDIVMFFLLIRLICKRRPSKVLLAFDKTGEPLVHYVEDLVTRRRSEGYSRSWKGSSQSKLYMALVAVCAIRLFIILIWIGLTRI